VTAAVTAAVIVSVMEFEVGVGSEEIDVIEDTSSSGSLGETVSPTISPSVKIVSTTFFAASIQSANSTCRASSFDIFQETNLGSPMMD
jgi:hypothetical protein